MSLKKAMTNEKGFTIVELLIVVIVIAILATITIVSFNNITGRANQSAADSAVATYVKKAELYLADSTNGRYPLNAAALSASSDADKSFYLQSGVVNTTIGATGDRGLSTDELRKNSVAVAPCPASPTPTATTVTGVRIYAWNFTGTNAGTVTEKRTLGTGC